MNVQLEGATKERKSANGSNQWNIFVVVAVVFRLALAKKRSECFQSETVAKR